MNTRILGAGIAGLVVAALAVTAALSQSEKIEEPGLLRVDLHRNADGTCSGEAEYELSLKDPALSEFSRSRVLEYAGSCARFADAAVHLPAIDTKGGKVSAAVRDVSVRVEQSGCSLSAIVVRTPADADEAAVVGSLLEQVNVLDVSCALLTVLLSGAESTAKNGWPEAQVDLPLPAKAGAK